MNDNIIQWEGQNIRLRPFTEKDMEMTLVWRNDSYLRDNQLGHPFPVTSIMEQRWFSRIMAGQDNNQVSFAIEEKNNDKLLGYISLTEIDWIAGTARLGITIGEILRHGQGFGRETCEVMLHYAFQTLNLRRIWLQVVAYNLGAIHLYEKIGFAHEGVLKQHVFRQGKHHDLILMGIFLNDLFSGD